MATTVDPLLIVQNNTAPSYDFTLKRDGVVIDLTSATVKLYIQSKSSGEITNTGHETCTVTDAVNGVIEYTAHSGDFPERGTYIGDIEVTYGSGGVERIYEQAIWKVRSKIE